MANNTSEIEISVEVLQGDLPLRKNMYGSVIVDLIQHGRVYDRKIKFELFFGVDFLKVVRLLPVPVLE